MSDKYAALRAAKPYELRFSRLWERYDEACHGNAEHMRDILELTLDALETAERHIVNADRDVRALTEALEKREELRAAANRVVTQQDIEICELRQRIAELEARTLTVKLPQRYSMLHRSDFDEPYHTEMVYKQHEVLEMLAAAGISLKIEGE